MIVYYPASVYIIWMLNTMFSSFLADNSTFPNNSLKADFTLSMLRANPKATRSSTARNFTQRRQLEEVLSQSPSAQKITEGLSPYIEWLEPKYLLYIGKHLQLRNRARREKKGSDNTQTTTKERAIHRKSPPHYPAQKAK